MITILLTGFEPFDGATTNSSADAVALVTGIPNLVTAVLPVEFGRASMELADLIARHDPAVVIAVGLAEGRSAITPERVAINLEDARIPDNAGAQPRETPVVSDGPDAHFSRLPVSEIAAAIAAAGIRSRVSLSAGAFVCNSLMYRLLHDARREVAAGFIHVPSRDDMPVEEIARGLEIAIRVTVARVLAQGAER